MEPVIFEQVCKSSGFGQVDRVKSQFSCCFNIFKKVINKKGFLRLDATVLHHVFKYIRIGFAQMDLMRKIGFFKKVDVAVCAINSLQVIEIIIQMNGICIAEQKGTVRMAD